MIMVLLGESLAPSLGAYAREMRMRALNEDIVETGQSIWLKSGDRIWNLRRTPGELGFGGVYAFDLDERWTLERIARAALSEDVGSGDATSSATVPEIVPAVAKMVARESLVVCGLDVAEKTFHEVSPKLRVEKVCSDGKRVEKGETILTIEGSARAILTAERVALNFVQRLSGVATLTAGPWINVPGANGSSTSQ